MDSPATPEFSEPLDIRSLEPGEHRHFSLVPDAETLSALKARLGLLSLSGFRADLTVARLDAGAVSVTGAVGAEVSQPCGLTLAPVPETVAEDIEIVFLPAEAFAAFEENTPPEDLLEGPDVEPLESDSLDLGEIATQSLALGLDPFPRAPGADLPGHSDNTPPQEGEGRPSPFAKLAQLKREE